MNGRRLVVMVGMLALATGCGGAQKSTAPAPTAPDKPTWEPPPFPTDGAIGLLGVTGPDKPWGTLTYDEKEWYMVGKVHPVMRQVFQLLDAKKYEGLDFECAICHGSDAKARQYKMPAAHLSPIPPYDSEDFRAMYNSKIVQFMAKRVTPAMGRLVGAPDFNPQTGEGFSCYGCHPKG